MHKNKILIVDDNTKNIQLVLNLLKEFEYSFSYAVHGRDALELVKNDEFDLILLDIMMPEINGYDVAKKIKQESIQTPIIFLTAKVSPEHIVKGFEAGAVDYITKPFNSKELIARVKTHLELSNLRKELHFKATTDYLTKLSNRRDFYEKAEDFFAKSENLAVAIIDIDYFKKVNDTFGHEAGDKVLIEFAKLIKNIFEEDITGRIGGEEFAIIFKVYGIDMIYSKLEEIRLNCENMNFIFNNTAIPFTISSGLAYGSTLDMSLSNFLKKADDSLYNSKNDGRNKITTIKI